MVPDETSDLPTTLPEASFLNPNWKVPSEARSLRGLFPVPVFAEFPSYSLSKNADGFLQNPFWLSYCNLRKLKLIHIFFQIPRFTDCSCDTAHTPVAAAQPGCLQNPPGSRLSYPIRCRTPAGGICGYWYSEHRNPVPRFPSSARLLFQKFLPHAGFLLWHNRFQCPAGCY